MFDNGLACVCLDLSSLLENTLSTSVIYDFIHRFLTDVESIIVNISFLQSMLM